MSKRKRRIFSREFKLSAVQRLLAGESTKGLSGELGIPVGHLDLWCQQFRLGGAEGLRKAGRPRKRGPVWTRWRRSGGRRMSMRPANTLPSWKARSGSNRLNSIFFDKPCSKSGKHAGRATGLA